MALEGVRQFGKLKVNQKVRFQYTPELSKTITLSGTIKDIVIDGKGTKKEPMKYTGDLITGIATMHKSNAVPVMKGTDQAKDIARMRR